MRLYHNAVDLLGFGHKYEVADYLRTIAEGWHPELDLLGNRSVPYELYNHGITAFSLFGQGIGALHVHHRRSDNVGTVLSTAQQDIGKCGSFAAVGSHGTPQDNLTICGQGRSDEQQCRDECTEQDFHGGTDLGVGYSQKSDMLLYAYSTSQAVLVIRLSAG